ncbi:two-component system sensor histidine kinase MtrB [Streptomyces sp. 3330]|uniref:HAMP domain-containing sensor histidine kinase n=1 Tax=Streptomyces sp. 3330 TaxID=2817755 RepID=UPI002855AC0E|nr:HAMP domain-containing sensor histidine kinase [Streptomyces sp. 3330]MDR6974332.1 two-component system sensor histidine kinase MtrB [Streptomyces sp. 3330]
MRAVRVTRSLRGRLLLAFAGVAVVGTLGTGALIFREARTALLQVSQDTAIDQTRQRVSELSISLRPPFDRQVQLATLAEQVADRQQAHGWRVQVTYRGHSATAPVGATLPEVTPALREAVAGRPVTVFQRVTAADRPFLVVGMAVAFAGSGSGSPRPSGLVVFVVVPQSDEQATVRTLIASVQRATVWALLPAVLLALLAARSVLRPVRALRQATRLMAAGRLDTRLAVQGSDELAELSRSFNETAAALEQTVAELRDMEARARRFAANVSHELRTPLAAMVAVTDVLDEDAEKLDPDTASSVRLVSDGVSDLARLVEDLLEISRFDAHAAQLNLSEIDLAESVQQSLASRQWLARVDTALPAPGNLIGRVDPRRFDVIVANLVANALAHGKPPARVSLTTSTTADGTRQAVLTVSDSGPGISQQALPLVFERFYRSDTARATSDGSGLGLSITRENVQLHQGTVFVANRPQGGAVFTVILPLPDGPSVITRQAEGSDL